MRWRIITTDDFNRKLSKLDKSLGIKILKEVDQLNENPFRGKPLGYNFFREKKVKNYRFYYLIFKEKVVVLVISLSSKKNQQAIIDKIKNLIPFYKKRIEENLFEF